MPEGNRSFSLRSAIPLYCESLEVEFYGHGITDRVPDYDAVILVIHETPTVGDLAIAANMTERSPGLAVGRLPGVPARAESKCIA